MIMRKSGKGTIKSAMIMRNKWTTSTMDGAYGYKFAAGFLDGLGVFELVEFCSKRVGDTLPCLLGEEKLLCQP